MVTNAAAPPPSNIGPLIVCPENPHYFATPDAEAVWMAGSHIWCNGNQQWAKADIGGGRLTTLTLRQWIDRMRTYEAANWIRIWFQPIPVINGGSFSTPPPPSSPFSDMPFNLPNANGLWDLMNYNQPQWDKVRADIQYAAQQTPAVYIQWQLWPCGNFSFGSENATNPWLRNVNNCAPVNGDDLYSHMSGPIWNMMFAYAKKACDTVHDLPNVVWDITGNELAGSAAQWSFMVALRSAMIQYELTNGYMVHPHIFCSGSGGSNPSWNGDQQLWSGPQEAVCPGWGDTVTPGLFSTGWTGYNVAPPPGNKPGFIDVDHTALDNTSPDGVLTTFTRGWGGYLMMDVGDDTVTNSSVSAVPPVNQFVDPPYGRAYPQSPHTTAHHDDRLMVRQAIWAARTASLMVNLTHMIPSGGTSSTGRCLAARDNTEFIVYQPKLGSQFTLNLPAGFNWSVTWVDAREQTIIAGPSLVTYRNLEIPSSVIPLNAHYSLCVIKQTRITAVGSGIPKICWA